MQSATAKQSNLNSEMATAEHAVQNQSVKLQTMSKLPQAMFKQRISA
jgi:hypothetical protein